MVEAVIGLFTLQAVVASSQTFWTVVVRVTVNAALPDCVPLNVTVADGVEPSEVL